MTNIILGKLYKFMPGSWPDDEDEGRPSEIWVIPLTKIEDTYLPEDTTYLVRELGKREVFVVYENELSTG